MPAFRHRLVRAVLVLAATVALVAPEAAHSAPVRLLPYTAANPLKIVTLGDSITYGPTTPATDTTGYRAELGKLLRWSNVPATLKDRSIVGGTIPMFLQETSPGSGVSNAKSIALTDQPDLVIVALGTNDAAQTSTYQGFKANYKQLISELQAGKPNVKVIATFIQISGPPNDSVGYTSAERQINDWVYQTIYGDGAPFGSPLLAPYVGTVPWNNLPSTWHRSDGVHPADQFEYDVMGSIVFDAVGAWLGLPNV